VSPADIVADLDSKGISLVVDGDKLRCKGKQSALTPDLLEELRQHKAGILALLTRTACTCDPLPSQTGSDAQAQAGCGPQYERCHTCGYSRQCKLCGGCRRCRSPWLKSTRSTRGGTRNAPRTNFGTANKGFCIAKECYPPLGDIDASQKA
jgi:hypothetical protein